MEPCPSPEVWSAWLAGALSPEERRRRAAHLGDCPACRDELAALSEEAPAAVSGVLMERWERLMPRRALPWRRVALAAGILLAVGLVLLRKEPPSSPRPASPAVAGPARAAGKGLLEQMVGKSGKLSLTPGSLARLENGKEERPGIHLERGTAWIEAAGEPIRLSMPGCGGILEVLEGEVLAQVSAPEAGIAALMLRSAGADVGAWGLWVLKGEAKVLGPETRVLKAGDRLGNLQRKPLDFRGWEEAAGGSRRLRDVVAVFSPPLSEPFVSEMLLAKRDPAAEAALVFSVGGKTWRMPLGAHLPAQGALRLRLEAGGDRVRLLAGERELFACAPGRLGEIAYPETAPAGWGLKVWGGELEVLGAHWRRESP